MEILCACNSVCQYHYNDQKKQNACNMTMMKHMVGII